MFGRLFGSKKAAQREKLPPLPGAVSSSILSLVGVKGIPSMEGVAQRTFQLATDPNAEAKDFIDVIGSDEGLTARIIKIANSVYFDRGKKTSTIEESVLVIGLEELRCVLNATSFSHLFPCTHPLRVCFWAHDVAVGIFSRAIARIVAPEVTEFAFLAGLMHDMGKLLLLQRAQEYYLKVIQHIEREGMSFSEAEALVFPFDHTEVGQLIGERWAFNDELLTVVRTHHRPLLNTSDPTPYIKILQCADAFAHAAGIGHPKNFHRFQQREESRFEELYSTTTLFTTPLQVLRADLMKTYERESALYSSGIST